MSGRWVCAVKTCGVVQSEPHVDGCPYAAPAPDPAGDTDAGAAVERVLSDLIADHPMWDGIDYTMEREAKIAAFVAEAAAALAGTEAAQ